MTAASPTLTFSPWERDFRYGVLWRRFGAAFADGILLDVMLIPVVLFVPHDWIVASAATWAYGTLAHWRFRQTLGKRWLGIEVLHASESRNLTLSEAARRDPKVIVSFFALLLLGPSSLFVLALIVAFAIGDPLAATLNQRRRALHDYLACSVVRRAHAYSEPQPQPPRSFLPHR